MSLYKSPNLRQPWPKSTGQPYRSSKND